MHKCPKNAHHIVYPTEKDQCAWELQLIMVDLV